MGDAIIIEKLFDMSIVELRATFTFHVPDGDFIFIFSLFGKTFEKFLGSGLILKKENSCEEKS